MTGTSSADALQQQLAFLRELEKLKAITRRNRTVDDRWENSAEHSWHVATMAQVLQPYAEPGIDMLRVTRILLIHDIVEIDAGDTFLYAEDQGPKQVLELRAAKRLFALLPDKQGDEYMQLWLEFENQASAEARFAAVIDGIQPLLNHLLTGRVEDGTIKADQVLAKKAFIREFAPQLWDLVEDLVEQSISAGLYD